MNNREILIGIMFDHELDRRDLAELVLADRQTVDSWLAPGESSRHVEVPDMAIELLYLKLGIKPSVADADEPGEPDEI